VPTYGCWDRFALSLWPVVAVTGFSQERTPRTGWGDKAEVVEPAKTGVATDLQALFNRSSRAASVIEFNNIIEGSRTIAKDTTRSIAERDYAKKLLSWAANRRGELRSDTAAQMAAADGQAADASALDRTAAEDFLLAIQFDESRWRAHHNLGVARRTDGEIDSAMESFGKTIELQPQFRRHISIVRNCVPKRNDLTGAIADYDKAIELSPDDPGIRTARRSNPYPHRKSRCSTRRFPRSDAIAARVRTGRRVSC
jgi:tetratricopeptide (TPR) repeat protein